MEKPRGVLIPPTFAMNAKDADRILSWVGGDDGRNDFADAWDERDDALVERLRVWRDRHAETP